MERLIAVITLGVALLAGLSPAFCATNAQEVEEDCSLDSALATPHEPWGKGWAAGAARALYFVYTGPYDGTWEDTGTRVREAVELQQRFDLPGEAVLFCGKGDNWVFHGLREGEKRAEKLMENPYDLYIIAGFAFERLPAKMQYMILEKVAKGAGLVCCGAPAKDFMVARREITPAPVMLTGGLPALDGKPASQYVGAYQLGRGRGVWLKYSAQAITPFKEFSFRALSDYEYWMALAGRAALWAAGKEGTVQVAAVNGDETASISRDMTDSAAVLSLTTTARREIPVTVFASLRRADDGLKIPLGQHKAALRPDDTTQVRVPLPSLRAGEYYVDARVIGDTGAVAFGAGLINVTSEAGVEKVELNRTFVERGETITASVTLRSTPPEGSLLRMRLRDSYDRVLVQRDIPVQAGQTEFTFDYTADEFATILMRCEAALIAGGDEVEMRTAEFTVPKRRQGQFNFVMWDAPRDTLAAYAWRQLQDAGHNVCLLGAFGKSKQPAALKACDASIVPYSTRILDPKDENGYMQPVCWNDDPAAAEYVQTIVDNQVNLREQGVFVYSLGDEGVTKGCCVHPECIAAYRRWLQGQYGTIEALNESWGSNYESFDEVNLLDPKDNMETQAQKSNFPRWFDRAAFARYNLMQFSGRFVEGYRRLDPHSLCGFEGTGGFGDDYDAITKINTFYGPYPSLGDDIVRSIYARDRVRSNWMGYSKTGDALSDAAWRMVIKGMDSVWYWMWSGIGSWRGYLRPTLDFWPAIEDVKDEMQPVREGLGDLLLKSEMLDSGIAVFYSVPSALSGSLENSGSFASAEGAHNDFVNLTYELGRDVKYVTAAMLVDGELERGKYRVLLLPMAQALSPEEAATIRQFVENGGTVIADVRPGVYDGHCKPVMPGLLDDLFGITRKGRGTPKEMAVDVSGAVGGMDFSARIPRAKVDTDVAAAGAQALGMCEDTPVMLVNSVGSGRAVLLNFHPTVGRTIDPEGVGTRAILKALYESAGASAVVEMSAPDGGPLPVTETRVWASGDSLVFGLMRRMENAWFGPKSGTTAGAPQPARIMLPQPMHVYDLRAGEYLGLTKQVDTRLKWGRASFFLASPRQITGLSLALSAQNPQPGEPFEATVSLDLPAGSADKQAVWVQVIDPQGNSPLWGRQVAILEGGKATVPMLIAANDQPGTWRVRATELFSKQTAEATWTVR